MLFFFFFQFLKNIILLLLQKLLHKISLSCYHLSINLNSSALLQILLSFNFTRFHGTCLDRSKTVSRSKIIWFEKISNQKAFIHIHTLCSYFIIYYQYIIRTTHFFNLRLYIVPCKHNIIIGRYLNMTVILYINMYVYTLVSTEYLLDLIPAVIVHTGITYT